MWRPRPSAGNPGACFGQRRTLADRGGIRRDRGSWARGRRSDRGGHLPQRATVQRWPASRRGRVQHARGRRPAARFHHQRLVLRSAGRTRHRLRAAAGQISSSSCSGRSGTRVPRFTEDKLRLLRAVRFGHNFGFQTGGRTRAAMQAMAAQVTAVSPERIAAEMRHMLVMPRAPPPCECWTKSPGLLAVLYARSPQSWPQNADSYCRPGCLADCALAVLARSNEPDLSAGSGGAAAPFLRRADCVARCAGNGGSRIAKPIAPSGWSGMRPTWPMPPASPGAQVQRLLLQREIEGCLATEAARATPGPAGTWSFAAAWLARPAGRTRSAAAGHAAMICCAWRAARQAYTTAAETVRDAQFDGKIPPRRGRWRLVDDCLAAEEKSAERGLSRRALPDKSPHTAGQTTVAGVINGSRPAAMHCAAAAVPGLVRLHL